MLDEKVQELDGKKKKKSSNTGLGNSLNENIYNIFWVP